MTQLPTMHDGHAKVLNCSTLGLHVICKGASVTHHTRLLMQKEKSPRGPKFEIWRGKNPTPSLFYSTINICEMSRFKFVLKKSEIESRVKLELKSKKLLNQVLLFAWVSNCNYNNQTRLPFYSIHPEHASSESRQKSRLGIEKCWRQSQAVSD